MGRQNRTHGLLRSFMLLSAGLIMAVGLTACARPKGDEYNPVLKVQADYKARWDEREADYIRQVRSGKLNETASFASDELLKQSLPYREGALEILAAFAKFRQDAPSSSRAFGWLRLRSVQTLHSLVEAGVKLPELSTVLKDRDFSALREMPSEQKAGIAQQIGQGDEIRKIASEIKEFREEHEVAFGEYQRRTPAPLKFDPATMNAAIAGVRAAQGIR